MDDTRRSQLELLLEENVGLIEQGVELITGLDPEHYRANDHRYFRSGVGKHFRHVLDFYERLLNGHDSIVDYEARRRDERIEADPDFACRAARTLAGALGNVVRSAEESGRPVQVRTEVRSADGGAVEAASTLERELAVLASHTVHHYAIIALLLRVQDVEVPASFGVAPSTLRHEAAGSQ